MIIEKDELVKILKESMTDSGDFFEVSGNTVQIDGWLNLDVLAEKIDEATPHGDYTY